MRLISKLLLLVIVIIGIFSVSVGGLFYFVTYNNMIQSQTSEAITLTESFAAELANPVYFLDISQIESITARLRENHLVVNVQVYDTSGRLLSEDFLTSYALINKNNEFFSRSFLTEKTTYTLEQGLIRVSSPIVISEKIGILLLDYSLEKFNDILHEVMMLIVIFALIMSMIGIVSGYFISKSITGPLENLKKITNEIAQGNKNIEITSDGSDEIKDLAKNIQYMADELVESQKTLVRTERLSAIGQLAARIAHDIRNPISIIKNSIELIRINNYEHIDEKLQTDLERIERATSRISHQINNVMDFVRIRPLELEEINLNDIILSVLEEQKIDRIKMDLQVNEFVIKLNADSKKLEVLFTNLVLNAQQAIRGNGDIIIRVNKKDDSIDIEIEDTANALSENDVAKLFEPLYTTKQNGTGLGLVSCKNIVESHGGKINVRVKPTVFHITLPSNLESKILVN